MRTGKVLGWLAGGVLALAVVFLIAIRLLVDPNHYRGMIEQRVRQATGRELSLPGDMHLSVFPWLALEFGPASLGNPAGFPAQPFVSVKRAVLRVRLLPLLRHELEVGHVTVEGLDLQLLKNEQNRGNWQGLAGEEERRQPGTPSTSHLPQLAGLTVKDSRISFQGITVDNLNLEVGAVRGDAPVPVDLHLTLGGVQGGQPQPLHARMDVSVGAQGTIHAANVALDAGPAHLTGEVRGEQLGEVPRIQGSFTLAPVNLRQLLVQLRGAAPATRDPAALSRLAAHGLFSYAAGTLRLTDMQLALDESTLRGTITRGPAAGSLAFDLSVDRIDADRYLGPKKKGGAAEPAVQTPDTASASDSKGDDGSRADGTVSIGSARIAGLTATQVQVRLSSQNHVVHLQPLRAVFYGGACEADVILDERSPLAALKLDGKLTGVDMAALLKDLGGTRRLSGHGDVSAALAARGDTADAVIRTLAGHVSANLANGAVEGLDLWFEVNRALALANQGAMPAGSSSGRTRFDTFRASADIKRGVATTHDLNIVSSNLRIAGQGTFNLATDAVDYQLDAALQKGAPGTADVSRGLLADIPVTVTGTITSPRVRPDLSRLARARIESELDKHKDDIQNKVQDVLKGLLH